MPYRKIVAGTDGSATATRALRHAAGIAKAEGGELLIVCVYHPPSPEKIAREIAAAPAEVAWRVTGTAAAEEIVAAAAEVASKEGVAAKTFVEPGDAADRLLSVAESEGADLIVVGNKGMTGVSRFVLGSVPNRVSHHAPCDVLIIRTT
ncbi:MAG: universal stress protein [Actinomycetota bacterium]